MPVAQSRQPSPAASTASSASATFYTITGNSDFYWRVTAPARAIGAKTCLIPEDGGWYAVTQPNTDTPFRWTQNKAGFTNYPDHEGVAVWTRPDLPRATHAKAMRELFGVRTVAETDDNYLADPRFNIYMRSNGFDRKARLDHMKAMASMNAIVYSTAWLRDFYHRQLAAEFGRKRVPAELVCRNHVFTTDWPVRDEYDGPVRVGWMGSPSHLADVNLAWAALRYAQLNGAETYMIGYDPSDPESAVTTDRARENVDAWSRIGYTHIPWAQMDSRTRMPLPLDIGLCPLLTNEFTLAKSDIKAIEYTIAGAAVVAQNNLVYNRDWVHGETCLLAGSPSEMLDMVALLMRDTRLRERLVANAQQYVRENRTEKQLAEEWGQILAD